MYSPKIREDLIPRIHEAAEKAGIAMTVWVNRVIEHALSWHNVENDTPENKPNNSE